MRVCVVHSLVGVVDRERLASALAVDEVVGAAVAGEVGSFMDNGSSLLRDPALKVRGGEELKLTVPERLAKSVPDSAVPVTV